MSLIIDLARAKSEALVNNTCNKKKSNCVMLNGDDNENRFKTNRKVTREGERVSRVNFLTGGNFH